MADAPTPEEAFDALCSHLHDLPAGMDPRRTQGPIDTSDQQVVESIRVWLNELYAVTERCGVWIKTPPVGRGLDSAWLRRLAKELAKIQEGCRQYGSLSEFLWHARGDSLGNQITPFAEASYQIAKFRTGHTPGGIAGLLEDATPDVWSQLRRLAASYEQRWIGDGLPPRRGNGAMQLVTPHFSAQTELSNTVHDFRTECGTLLLRASDDLLIPDDLRKDIGFADAIYHTFRGGAWPGTLFDRLCDEWLAQVSPGYGGSDYAYPGCDKDDRERFNEGVRVARCAMALADALQPEVVGSERKLQPPTSSLADDSSPETVLAHLERFQLLMDAANASASIREAQAKGKDSAADVVQAAKVWAGGESQVELCALASILSEEAEYHQCAEGGRCLALVGLNYWQCLRQREPINAYTIRQTLAELRSKLRAAVRREAVQQPANHSQPQSDNEPSAEPVQAPQPANNTQNDGVASESDLLGKSLVRLRERFEDGFRRHQKLTGVMVHHTSPTQGPQPHWPDATVEGLIQLQQYGGLNSEPKQLSLREDYARVADRPFLDADGNPITTTAGEPIPMVPGWIRMIGLYGQHGRAVNHEEVLGQSADAFDDCCRVAGSLVRGLDQGVKNVIWQDWTTAVLLPDDAGLWLSAVFELAWQGHDGSGLKADRSGWLGRHSAPIDLIAKYLDGSQRSMPIEELANAVGDPPGYWFSKLENLWQASAAAIDLLIGLLNSERTDRPALGTTQLPAPEGQEPAASKVERADDAHAPDPVAAPDPYEVDEDLAQIRIDGTAHNVPSEAARMAKLLLEAKGEWVGMFKKGFTKASETKKKLPKAIQAMIESEKGKGYRLAPRR